MKFQLILGPCVMESYDHVMYCAEKIKSLTYDLSADVTFKASFDTPPSLLCISYTG